MSNTIANVTVADLRRGYNAGKATGRTHFTPAAAPTYCGEPVDFHFCRFHIVEYISIQTGKVVARFQDDACIDD